MRAVYSLILTILAVYFVGLNAFAGPRDPLSKAAKDASYAQLIAIATLVEVNNVDYSLTNLQTIMSRVSAFEAYYHGEYTKFQGADRLSPYEMSRAIESMTKIESFFNLILNPKNMSLLLGANDRQNLEMVALKSTIMIQRLTLEIKNVAEANSSNPDRHRMLFEDVNMNKIKDANQAINTLSWAVTRLSLLEAQAKSCIGLF